MKKGDRVWVKARYFGGNHGMDTVCVYFNDDEEEYLWTSFKLIKPRSEIDTIINHKVKEK